MSNLHIHAPAGEYIGQVRGYGKRKWRTVAKKRRSAEKAMAAAIQNMKKTDKRARVLFCADWYDPVIVMEASRK